MVRAIVLAGGPSSEHEISLLTSAALLRVLRAGGHAARPVWLDQDGGWHLGADGDDVDAAMGRPGVEVAAALDLISQTGEVVVVGLHGPFGEDGTLQRLLDDAAVPYTGSASVASSVGMDKELSKLAAMQVGARTARHHLVSGVNPPLLRIARTVGYPCFVKPVSGGSSVGAGRVDSEEGLAAAVAHAQSEDPDGRALVEEWVGGEEVTCAVLRVDGELTVLPIVAIVPAKGFYDYHAKYEASDTGFVCPARISDAAASEIRGVATRLYEALDLRGATRVDFLMPADDGAPVFLELNTLPGMTDHSLVPLAARTAGLSPVQLVDALLADAVRPA